MKDIVRKALRSFDANLPFFSAAHVPQTIQLILQLCSVERNRDISYKTRLRYKIFSKNTVSIIGIPQDVRLGSEEKILQEIISEYININVKKN